MRAAPRHLHSKFGWCSLNEILRNFAMAIPSRRIGCTTLRASPLLDPGHDLCLPSRSKVTDWTYRE